ncbi:MAG: hypothetical protein AB3N22_07670 [Ruegeria sp.]
MEIKDPDEKAEARAVGIWLARGFVLTLIGGVLWAFPIGNQWVRFLAAAVAVVLTILAFSLASLSATITRNIVGRFLKLHAHPRIVLGMGLAILACYIALMMAVFLFGTSLFPDTP